MPDQFDNANQVPEWFSDMWVPELLLPPKIIRMFGPTTAIFAPKYAFLGTYDSFSDVGESRVWWRADFQSGSRVLKKVF